jgi:hypothetical protein
MAGAKAPAVFFRSRPSAGAQEGQLERPASLTWRRPSLFVRDVGPDCRPYARSARAIRPIVAIAMTTVGSFLLRRRCCGQRFCSARNSAAERVQHQGRPERHFGLNSELVVD